MTSSTERNIERPFHSIIKSIALTFSKGSRALNTNQEMRSPYSSICSRSFISWKKSRLFSKRLSTDKMSHSSLSITRVVINLSRTIRTKLVIGHANGGSTITIPSNSCLHINTPWSLKISRNNPDFNSINLKLIKNLLKLSKHRRLVQNRTSKISFNAINTTCIINHNVINLVVLDNKAADIALLHSTGVLSPEATLRSVKPERNRVRTGVSAAAGVTCHLRRGKGTTSGGSLFQVAGNIRATRNLEPKWANARL